MTRRPTSWHAAGLTHHPSAADDNRRGRVSTRGVVIHGNPGALARVGRSSFALGKLDVSVDLVGPNRSWTRRCQQRHIGRGRI
jgi:hypothetical protein